MLKCFWTIFSLGAPEIVDKYNINIIITTELHVKVLMFFFGYITCNSIKHQSIVLERVAYHEEVDFCL